MSKPQVSIQLYSVRDRTDKDFLGTIREMADIGYKNVELAGTFGFSAKEVRDTLDSVGISVPSAHVGLAIHEPDQVWDKLKESVVYYQELGVNWFVVPGYPLAANPTLNDVHKMADDLEKAGRIVTESGLAFGYHNHAFEFQVVEGKCVIDHILERVPADLLLAEFDLGWVKVGGQDPAEYVNKYAGRVPLVHAKDFKADGTDTEIGRGTVDWDAALAASEETGVKYVIIEQEQYDISSLESAKLNFAWFKERGWV